MTLPDTENALCAHWDLDPDVVFLNHGSFGACPREVLAAQSRYRAQMEREPVLFLGREIGERLDAAKEPLARFVGVASEDLVFVPNATTGVNSVLRSLEIAAGDELLFTDHAYNACRNAAKFVCERAGAVPVVVPVPFPLRSADEVVEALVAAVGPRTRLAMIDHVTSDTGLVLPVERIVNELAERGVETLVDGAHAPGMLALELEAMGVAYYTGNCHKWICTPKGSALLYVRRDLQDTVRPAVISHGANTSRPGKSRFQDEFDWIGTDDPTAYLSVPDAIEFFRELVPGGWPAIRERNRSLVLAARDLLCASLEVQAPAPDDMLGCLASVPLPAGDGVARGAFGVDPLQRSLFEEHRIEVPIVAWPRPPARLVRVSAQLYNDLEQYRTLADALGRLLAAEGA